MASATYSGKQSFFFFHSLHSHTLVVEVVKAPRTISRHVTLSPDCRLQSDTRLPNADFPWSIRRMGALPRGLIPSNFSLQIKKIVLPLYKLNACRCFIGEREVRGPMMQKHPYIIVCYYVALFAFPMSISTNTLGFYSRFPSGRLVALAVSCIKKLLMKHNK